ncbi:hypothetical protein HPB52_022232 [Rhipicephalus sanguineus]|uniref:CCHC-type domain-containing protein n=1 Tax=Rhipicephalus sanguineus TaxID=34632 RepID=A0A9D4TBQ6_RHISA|nr:hypothetical protein HPB52_022232 [Rhipicephalus sanguineus]
MASPPEATTTSPTIEPAAKPPAMAAIVADESAGLEATTENMDDESAPPPHSAAFLKAPAPSLPEDEVTFQVVKSRAAQRRARRIDSAALPVNPEVMGTVLFRPSAPGGSFRGLPCLTLAEALSGRPGVADIRVNHKRNIVAADVTSRDRLPVAAREPADRRTSTGLLHGVDGEPAGDSLLPAIQSPVPVLSASREGRTVSLRFEGRVPPEQVSLLRCRQCGRFGHVKESCSWPNSCIRCGRPHPKDWECQRPRCVKCSGAHPANTPACPRWQQERRAATIMASSTTALSRRVVRAAVREETRTDRDLVRVAPSYASILQGVSKPAAPTPRASHRPPPAAAPTGPSAPQSAAHGPAASAVVFSARARTPAANAVVLPAAVPARPGLAVSTENQEAVNHMVRTVLMAMQFACTQVSAAHQLHAIYQQADEPRVAVYVRRELPHVVVDVAWGPLECCAVTVRLWGVHTTVASVYIRPRPPCDATMLTRLTPRLGRHYLLCGKPQQLSSREGPNGCRPQAGAPGPQHRVLHTYPAARQGVPNCHSVTLATPGVCYGWATAADSWGSDHLPIHVTPVGGEVPRSWRCEVADWRIYRQHLDDPMGHRDFFGAMARAAEAATIVTTVTVNQSGRGDGQNERTFVEAAAQSSTALTLPAEGTPTSAGGRDDRASGAPLARAREVPRPGEYLGLSSLGHRCGNFLLQSLTKELPAFRKVIIPPGPQVRSRPSAGSPSLHTSSMQPWHGQSVAVPREPTALPTRY